MAEDRDEERDMKDFDKDEHAQPSRRRRSEDVMRDDDADVRARRDARDLDDRYGARSYRDDEMARGERYRRADAMRGGYDERAGYRFMEVERARRYNDDYYDERDARAGARLREDERRAPDERMRGEYPPLRYGRRGRGAVRSRLRCRDIMTKDVTVATVETSLQEVALMMRDDDTGIIPVVGLPDNQANAEGNASTAHEARRANVRLQGHGVLLGLITDRDIVVRAVAEGKDLQTTLAADVMTKEVHTAHPNDRVIDAIRTMGDKQVRRIPVVGERGNLRGIISMADIALETEEDQELADALEEISSGSSFWNKIFG